MNHFTVQHLGAIIKCTQTWRKGGQKDSLDLRVQAQMLRQEIYAFLNGIKSSIFSL